MVKLLTVFQGYIDDSASDTGDRRLFFAGYINTADRWIRFSGAWKEELRSIPSIKYLKMREANYLNGEFRGWSASDRDQKLRGLSRVIRHFKPLSIHCSVSRAELDEIIRPVAPHGLANPHFFCLEGTILPLANYQHKQGLDTPIDFIFDSQESLGEEARFFYEKMREMQPRHIRRVLSKTIIFHNDKEVLPLQAADMLAWHVRRNAERDGLDKFLVPDFLSHDGLHMAMDFDADKLRTIAAGLTEVPGAARIRPKGQWKQVTREIKHLESLGIDTTLIGKTLWWRLRERIGRILGR